MNRISLAAAAFLVLGALPHAAGAQGTELKPGQLVKAKSSSSVYYIDQDLSRHVFPNAKVFLSWYADFDGVIEVSDETIGEHPLAGNVPYKAAKRLIKIQTDPKVYAVDEGGVLRWVKNEAVAKALYGENWNQAIDDLSDAFFANYTMGPEIAAATGFDVTLHVRIKNIAQTLMAKRIKHLKLQGASPDELANRGYGKNKEAVCHKFGTADAHTIFIPKPAIPAHLGHGDVMGECPSEEEQEDETAPVISGATVSGVTDSGATVSFTTNENATATVYFSTTSPVDTDTAESESSAAAGTTHSIAIADLEADTAYHVLIEVEDAEGNKATLGGLTFTTLETPDTAPPTIAAPTVDPVGETTATVEFTTNEPTTAVVYYSTTTPVDTDTAAHVDSAALASSHEVDLTGLTASTTYHVVIVAEDASGNETTLGGLTFTTETPDTTPPALDGSVTIDEIGETGATVGFATDEPTTAVVYYSTTTPVDTDTAAHVDSAALASSHEVDLTGLAAGTEYHVLIVLSDEAGNDTTLAEVTFTTTSGS